MRIVSWNVNGLKSIINKGFKKVISNMNADIICIQETKVNNKIEKFILEGYYEYFNFSNVSGYSGVAIYSKKKAENIIKGMYLDDMENLDRESRVLTLEYNDFYIVCVYVPNSQLGLHRLNYRIEFDEIFNKHIEKLNNIKDVIICGDFNICYKNIDICNTKKHRKINNFSDEEKANFRELLNLGLIDTYRYMHPQMGKYTFWTNDVKNRQNCEVGWRLDYILVSEFLRKNVRQANILDKIEGSDHCPIELILECEDWSNE